MKPVTASKADLGNESMPISPEDLMRCRKAFNAAIQASREQRAAEYADHVITLAMMRQSHPHQALLIARDYAERHGFAKSVADIDAMIAELWGE